MTEYRNSRISRRSWLRSGLGLAGLAGAWGNVWAAPADKTGWVKSPHNPVLSLGPEGAFDSQNIMSPSVVKEAGKFYMFYAGGPSGPANGGDFVDYQVGLALSDDGVTWKKTGKPIVPLGERDNFHATPAPLRDAGGNLAKRDGLWHLLYCGNRADDVEWATSTDGLHWKKNPGSPIYHAAYSPHVIDRDGEIWLYYTFKPPRYNGRAAPWEIHLATGKDFKSLLPHPDNPVLKMSQPWEATALIYPYVLREGDTWVMFYASYWRTAPGRGAHTAIGKATSRDGIHWKKHAGNPVLMPTPGSSFDSRYCSAQSVIRDGDHYKMYYGARIDMRHKYYAIGLATLRGELA